MYGDMADLENVVEEKPIADAEGEADEVTGWNEPSNEDQGCVPVCV